jgi:hypothetical protein
MKKKILSFFSFIFYAHLKNNKMVKRKKDRELGEEKIEKRMRDANLHGDTFILILNINKIC